MDQKVLLVDARTGFYRVRRYEVGRFFGPVDLGLHLSSHSQSLNIGVGLLAGSIFPGSNRLFVTGFSPCWRGFYVSSMGGAGLVFDNLGLNMVSLIGKAPVPSILYLNRTGGEEVEVELLPVELSEVWGTGRRGAYALMDHVYQLLGSRYRHRPAGACNGAGGSCNRHGGNRLRAHHAGEAHRGGHVGGPGRTGEQDAPGARDRRGHLRRHLRGRGLPRPQGG